SCNYVCRLTTTPDSLQGCRAEDAYRKSDLQFFQSDIRRLGLMPPDNEGRGFTMMRNPAFQQDPGTVVRLPVDNPSLSLLLMVLDDFHGQAVSYCYWKSGRRIQSVLAGEGDLDLLIARHDQHRAEAILLRRG